MPLRLAVQSALLPGNSPAEWFSHAARFGFEGVELNHSDDFDVRTEFDAIAKASDETGVSVAAICTTSTQDPVAQDQDERNRRVSEVVELVDAASAMGAAGVISVPLRRSAHFDDLRLPELAIDIYQRIASNLGDGNAAIFLEPLNRYEASFLNRVGQAAILARMVEHSRVRALADLYHMNIEESNLGDPIDEAGEMLGHVHIADNTRDEPGAGMMDMRPAFAALKRIGYVGWLSLECRGLSGEPKIAFPASIAYLRSNWAEA